MVFIRAALRPIQRIPKHLHRSIHCSKQLLAIKPFILADIGEGIRECEVIQWFVEPEARVEQFDKLCEVQSDKASVEITSRYDGVIKRLHYRAGEMALVGKPLVDIDTIVEDVQGTSSDLQLQKCSPESYEEPTLQSKESKKILPLKHRGLATPAVRHICQQLGVEITDVIGTGKEGRVLKEDVSAFAERRSLTNSPVVNMPASIYHLDEDTILLTPIQHMMFKSMTQSLSIPQFLYCEEVILNSLDRIRQNLNQSLTSMSNISRITFTPFVIKAVSLALKDYPLLNGKLDVSDRKPRVIRRSQHNIGIAMDTPAGLIVPNIKNVETLNILEIAIELRRLQVAGLEGKLTPLDMIDGTITISNIGNIGGTVLAPIVVPTELVILGVGKSRKVPRFDENGEVVSKTMVDFSWSADHRVVDGATIAKMSTTVKGFLEEPEKLLMRLK